MPVVAYVDPVGVHDPAANVAPASWFTTHEANFRSIVGRVGASISEDTTQDVTTPGPTTILLGNVDWDNGMDTSVANQLTVETGYAGKYLVSAGVRLDSVTSGANFIIMLVTVNGGTAHQDYARRVGATGALQSAAFTFVYDLAVGDDLALQVTTSATHPTDLDTVVSVSQPYLAAVWRSP